MNKINLRLNAFELILKTLVCFCMTLILSQAHAQDEDKSGLVEDYRENGDLVELHVPIEVNAPYKARRNTHGFMFSIGYENVLMPKYISVIDLTTSYKNMFGETEFPLANLNLSYKYNFALGSVTLNGGVGYGTIASDGSGVERSLSLTKYAASASYIMDNMFDEPYVAPYGTVGVMNFALTETSSTTSVSGDLEQLMFAQAGLLFQLNWLEDDVSRKSLVDSGLENTYLDVYVAKYEPSGVNGDPDTSTELMVGAGLRLEY